jgi:hypothetical protein
VPACGSGAGGGEPVATSRPLFKRHWGLGGRCPRLPKPGFIGLDSGLCFGYLTGSPFVRAACGQTPVRKSTLRGRRDWRGPIDVHLRGDNRRLMWRLRQPAQVEAARPSPVVLIVAVAQLADPDALPPPRRMNELALPNKDSDVGQPTFVGALKKDEIARLKLPRLNPYASGKLRPRHAGKVDPPFGAHSLYQSRTVETGLCGAPAESISDPTIRERRARNILPARKCRYGVSRCVLGTVVCRAIDRARRFCTGSRCRMRGMNTIRCSVGSGTSAASGAAIMGESMVISRVRRIDGTGTKRYKTGRCANRNGPAEGPSHVVRSFRGRFSLPRPSWDRRTC